MKNTIMKNDIMRNNIMENNNGKKRIFIVARGRSGTTLLYKTLNKHPEIVISPEGMFMLFLYGKYKKGTWDRKRVRAFIEDLTTDKLIKHWDLDLPKLEETLANTENLDYQQACRLVQENHAQAVGKAGCRVLGDKNPHYSLFLKKIAAIFPDAKFVFMVRDYRDTILSYLKAPFDLNSVPSLASRWKDWNACIIPVMEQMPDRFFKLRYEDLVTEPERILKDMCNFLEIDYNDKMVTDFSMASVAITETNAKLCEKLRSPIDPDNMDKWKKKMSQTDQQAADYICGEMGKQFGYTPVYEQRSLKLFLKTLWGIGMGKSLTLAEKIIFQYFPPKWVMGLLNLYRDKTGARNG